MKKVLFCGCSYTSGYGFKLGKDEPNLWVNLLHTQGKFANCELTNASVPGRSNSGIFQDAVYNLVKDRYDYAVVNWTSVPRYELELGVETYTTRQLFTPNGVMFDVDVNQATYTKQYLSEIRDRFVSLATDHYEILTSVYYVNALVNLSSRLNTKIFFVNAICPWDKNYFVKLDNVLPNNYTNYTKKLINIDNRDDDEIFKIYNKIHNEYKAAGGIQEQHWLNLYSSLRSIRIDVNEDNIHPGIKSNQKYFKFLNQFIEL